MSTTPEFDIESEVVRLSKRAGWLSYKLCFIGVRGATDRLFGLDKRSILIEFKRPGRIPTQQQERRHRELRDTFGFEVHWCDAIDKGLAILGVSR